MCSDAPLAFSQAVLINGNSASTAEFLAAALQDNGVARLVGEHSFGKGYVWDEPQVCIHPSLVYPCCCLCVEYQLTVLLASAGLAAAWQSVHASLLVDVRLSC